MKSYLAGNPELKLALNEELAIGRGRQTAVHGQEEERRVRKKRREDWNQLSCSGKGGGGEEGRTRANPELKLALHEELAIGRGRQTRSQSGQKEPCMSPSFRSIPMGSVRFRSAPFCSAPGPPGRVLVVAVADDHIATSQIQAIGLSVISVLRVSSSTCVPHDGAALPPRLRWPDEPGEACS